MDNAGRGPGGGVLPGLPRFVSRRTHRQDGFDVRFDYEGIEPAIAVGDEARIPSRGGLDAAVDAVEKGIYHHIARGHPKFGEEALETPTRFSYQDTADNGFVLRWILADDQDPRGPVQAAAMKDWAPLEPKLARRVDINSRIVP